jgi:thioredoxin 1
MAPELKAADKQLGGQVQFLKVNIDENLRLLFRYMIVGIPTLLFFSHGRLVDRKAGKQNADAIIKRAEPLLTMDEQLAAKRAMKGWFRWPF